MDHRIASALPFSRVLTAILAAAGVLAVVLAAPSAYAQQPKPAPKKQAPAAAPAPEPAAPAAPAQAAPQLMYSPWTKICQSGPETNNKKVCATGIQVQIETGQVILVLQLIEPEGADKQMRGVVPIPVRVANGTRLLLDGQELARAPYVVCGAQTGCISEFKVDDAMIAKLKSGKSLDLQLVNVYNNVVSLPVSLSGFTKAYDGPPLDPKAFEEQQRKLQEELQKKAEDARKKLEAAQPTPPAKK